MKKFSFLLILSLTIYAQANKDVLHYLKLATAKKGAELKAKYSIPGDVIDFNKKDLKNGYLSYSLKGLDGLNEFAIWNKKDGKVITGETHFDCGPACGLSEITFLEFTGDKFTDITSKVYPKDKLEKLYKAKLAKIQAKGASGSETYWVKIPQKGTTIEIGINAEPENSDSKLIPVAELKWNGNSFDLSEKK